MQRARRARRARGRGSRASGRASRASSMCGVGLHAGAPISIDVGADADAAEQADANARGALPVAAEDDAAIEHRFEPVLDRADQERPADRLAERRSRRRARRASAISASGQRTPARHAASGVLMAAILGSRTRRRPIGACRRGLWVSLLQSARQRLRVEQRRRRTARRRVEQADRGSRPRATPSRAASAGWRWRCAA